jgi:catechol 2,3-dioxygenase-like lactoylglutathione lyase family enzyme
MHIDHIRLLVVHFAECFRFYRDVIGLTVKWGDENDTYASFSAAGETTPNLALFSRQEMADALGIGHFPTGGAAQDRAMLIIGVEDVDATVKRLESLGAILTLGPKNYPEWGMRSAYLRDPDGNLIELTGNLPREQWSPELRQEAQKYERT